MWRVIVARGISAVSVRSVADEAGLVLGSLRHVFPTRTELLSYSAELMVERASERVMSTPRGEDALAYACDVIAEVLPLTVDSRAEMEVNLALIAECPAEPSLVPIRDRAHGQLRGMFIGLVELVSGRVRDPEVVAHGVRLHALVDGMALHLLHAPLSAEAEGAARAIVRDEVARIAAELSPRA